MYLDQLIALENLANGSVFSDVIERLFRVLPQNNAIMMQL